MKRYFLILSILFFSCSNLFSSGPGSSAMYSLINPFSARSAALSGACSSLEGDISLMQYNPAALLTIPDYTFSFSYQQGYAKDSYASALFGMSLENTAIGGGLKYYGTGDLSVYDLYGYERKEAGQKDIIFILGSAQDFEFLSAGMNLKIFFSEIFGEKAFGFAADAGATYKPAENINAGLSLSNIGAPVTYIKKEESLPAVAQAGVSYTGLIDSVEYTLSLDLPYYINEQNISLNSGLEVFLHEYLILRGGAKLAVGKENKTDGMFTLGWRFGTGNIKFDYAVKISDDLNMPQFITTEINF
ncbi:MAG: PorV/PorQ family protein [Elusimicrobiota bacterium]